MKPTLKLFVAVLLLGTSAGQAAGLPDFASDQEADRWLREHSAAYLRMAKGIDRRGGYEIAATREYPGGVAYTSRGRGHIGLNDALQGAHRVSVLIFEITNLHQENRHQEVAQRVRTGELADPVEFCLLREMIEFDGLRLHYEVLLELQRHIEIPPAMITWVSSTARTFAEYRPPFAYDYIKAQKASGHTARYVKVFEKHRAEYTDSLRQKTPSASN